MDKGKLEATFLELVQTGHPSVSDIQLSEKLFQLLVLLSLVN